MTPLRVCMAVFWLLCGVAAAMEALIAPPSEKYLAPPVAWGVPLAGGPIRTLVIAPARAVRDTLELSSRIELDMDVITLSDRGEPDEAAFEEIRKRLEKRHDIIIAEDLELARLPEDVLSAIIARIREGTGLLLCHYGASMPQTFQEFLRSVQPTDSTDPVTRGVGESLSPEWRTGLGFVHTSTADKGRVAQLDYGKPAPLTHFLIPIMRNPLLAELEFFDNYLSLVARAARWAAGRDPEIWIAGVEAIQGPAPDDLQVPPELPKEYIQYIRESALRQPYRTYVARFGASAKNRYRVVTQVRQPGRNWQDRNTYNQPVRAGDDSYPIAVAAGAGSYFLDIWICDHRDRIVEWHSEPITINGWPRITALSFSKSLIFPNDAVDVTAIVEAPIQGQSTTIGYARAYDSLGRMVAEGYRMAPDNGGPTTVRLEFADLVARQLKVEFYVLVSDARKPTEWDLRGAAFRYGYLPVHQPDPIRPFSLLVRTDGLSEYNQRAFHRLLVGSGVDTAYTQATEESGFYLSKANIRPLFEVARCVPETVLDDVVRVPSLADVSFRQSGDDRLQKSVASLWGADSAMFSLGDGNCLSTDSENVCQSRESLDEFTEVLRKSYGDLPALNTAWSTQFIRWKDVTPAPEDAASTLGIYPPWLDFRLFMDRQFTDKHVMDRNAIQQVRQHALVGFNARPGSTAYLGYDWRPLASQLGVVGVPPDDLCVERIRSHRSPGGFTGICLWQEGASIEARYLHWYPWYAALHGFDSVWWGDSVSGAPRTIAPDGCTVSPDLQTLAQALDEVNDGTAALLRAAKRAGSEVAIYDSQASRYLSQVNVSSPTKTIDSERVFARLLNDVACPYDFVAREDAVAGKLLGRKLLVLPSIFVLADDEVAMIREFHKRGGHILADSPPGAFNEHGIPRAQPALSDLFDQTDGALAAEDGQQQSAWRESHHGEAMAVLADISLTDYDSGSDRERDSSVREALRGILERTGLKPLAFVTAGGGNAFDGECAAWEYGHAKAFVLVRDPDGKGTGRVVARFANPGAVYDARKGVKVANPRKVVLRMAAGDAAVLTSLPYEVTELTLETPSEISAGKRLPIRAGLKTKGGLPGEHIIQIDIAPVLGLPIRYYSRMVVCRNGSCETYIPLAYNEPVGAYAVRARDALTGISGRSIVTVRRTVETKVSK